VSHSILTYFSIPTYLLYVSFQLVVRRRGVQTCGQFQPCLGALLACGKDRLRTAPHIVSSPLVSSTCNKTQFKRLSRCRSPEKETENQAADLRTDFRVRLPTAVPTAPSRPIVAPLCKRPQKAHGHIAIESVDAADPPAPAPRGPATNHTQPRMRDKSTGVAPCMAVPTWRCWTSSELTV
jgi:hypothetical protein